MVHGFWELAKGSEVGHQPVCPSYMPQRMASPHLPLASQVTHADSSGPAVD